MSNEYNGHNTVGWVIFARFFFRHKKNSNFTKIILTHDFQSCRRGHIISHVLGNGARNGEIL